jgi:hypothetical protein
MFFAAGSERTPGLAYILFWGNLDRLIITVLFKATFITETG